MDRIKLYNCDNLDLMAKMEDESVDVILTDPPYLYLKNQKLERPFDEQKFFKECYRVLAKNGMLVYFGRGESFYRWGYLNSELVFTKENEVKYSFEILGSEIKKRNILNFKEEIIWNKNYNSSAVHPLSRVHESISIFAKGKGKINKVRVNYIESKALELNKIMGDIKRLRVVLSNSKELKSVQEYLQTKKIPIIGGEKKPTTTLQKGVKKTSVTASVMRMIEEGMVEKSIIAENPERYSRIFPTQKPVRLLERLLALVIPEEKERKDIVVADFFGGSFSTMEAVYNMGMQGIATEIDKEYFENGKKRISNLTHKLF